MKKALSVLLSLCCLLPVLGVALTANAVPLSLSAGKEALMAQFPDGKCADGLDYVYYSPVISENDSNKYPLVIWLHGRNSGTEMRKQLYSYDFCNWSSEEYQSRFAGGSGAFLLLPRSNTMNSDWFDTMTGTLKKTVDYFISLYEDNIDMSRIYIAGYSSGGTMVYHMVTAYPDFFAAILPVCAVYTVTPPLLDSLKNTSIWFFACTEDPYASSNALAVSTSFKYLSDITSRPEGVRMTTFTNAVWADGTQSTEDWNYQHFIWDAVVYDMHMKTGEPYLYATTKDAAGETISFEEGGLISWLSRQVKHTEKPAETGLVQRIIALIKSLLRYILTIFK